MKLTKNAKKRRGEIFHVFAGMTLLILNSKLCNFIAV